MAASCWRRRSGATVCAWWSTIVKASRTSSVPTCPGRPSVLLDAEDFGPASGYVLEVSSPGLDRELYGARDYERFSGSRVRVTFTDAGTTRRRTVRGELLGLSPEDPGIALIREDDSGDTLRLTIDSIHKARLLVEL